ncbi:DUF2515 domain-containing protein [Bacillus sp. B15-48]|nr:DUF2515 family protein [Bacillus sp. B15-48]MBM4762086.1 DUF2515 domain-containing protein [Bacillus sp. B15-48]
MKRTVAEESLLLTIRSQTNKQNVDNISRTIAYFDFYLKYPEVPWSFLASMVSRNAGYNMCDLEGMWFPKIMERDTRELFFKTYERANWTIFHDAYPQLLLYHYSTKKGQPMFHLLSEFNVSSFMELEWNYFWRYRDSERLMIALIVNEQNVIHNTVIEYGEYQKKVFHSLKFLFQDLFHFSAVLLPTIEGDLYGASVNGFRSVHKRIHLGKKIASILFHPKLYPEFLQFAMITEHTGSRIDYEQYFSYKKKRETPFLRWTFPVVNHHYRLQKDWYQVRKFHEDWMSPYALNLNPVHITDWFLHKQKQLQTIITIKEFLTTGKI